MACMAAAIGGLLLQHGGEAGILLHNALELALQVEVDVLPLAAQLRLQPPLPFLRTLWALSALGPLLRALGWPPLA